MKQNPTLWDSLVRGDGPGAAGPGPGGVVTQTGPSHSSLSASARKPFPNRMEAKQHDTMALLTITWGWWLSSHCGTTGSQHRLQAASYGARLLAVT